MQPVRGRGRGSYPGYGKGNARNNYSNRQSSYQARGTSGRGRSSQATGGTPATDRVRRINPSVTGPLTPAIMQAATALLATRKIEILSHIQQHTVGSAPPLVLVSRFSCSEGKHGPQFSGAFPTTEPERSKNITYPGFYVSYSEASGTFEPVTPNDGAKTLFKLNLDALDTPSEPAKGYVMNGKLACVGAVGVKKGNALSMPSALVLKTAKQLKNGRTIDSYVSAGGSVKSCDAVTNQTNRFENQVQTLARAALREFAEELLGVSEKITEDISNDLIVEHIKTKLGCTAINVYIRAETKNDRAQVMYLFEQEFDHATRNSFDVVIELVGGKSHYPLKSYLSQVKPDKRGQPTVVTPKTLQLGQDESRPAKTTAKLAQMYCEGWHEANRGRIFKAYQPLTEKVEPPPLRRAFSQPSFTYKA